MTYATIPLTARATFSALDEKLNRARRAFAGSFTTPAARDDTLKLLREIETLASKVRSEIRAQKAGERKAA